MQDATEFAPACPQDQGNHDWYRDVAVGFGAERSVIAELTNISEDCLYLNVWTSADSSGRPKPVMVWIHGGSNVNGYAHEPNYRGYRLAEAGVVVVSINYRLGVLGFMAHPRLHNEDENRSSGYYGLADQVAALEWIKQNIAAFGGDPNNVTVFGESAGGGNISALMRMPSAKGLFHKAIIQSGALAPYDSIDYDQALAAGERLIASLSVTAAGEMRSLDWQDLVESRGPILSDYYFGPIADGHYLPADEVHPPVPLMIGANRDEMLMYLSGDTLESLNDALDRYAGVARSQVSQFLEDNYGSIEARANRLSSAAEFWCPALDLAERSGSMGQPAYVYFFTRSRPGGDALLAYHGAEIPYVFDTADDWLPADQTDQRLAAGMQKYWINFSTNGNPNGKDLPLWHPYDERDRNILELGDDIRSSNDEWVALCDLLDSAH